MYIKSEENKMENINIMEDASVLCVANSYTSKFYFNPTFDNVPASIKEELKKVMVTLAEETGGISYARFRDGDGYLVVDIYADESDFYFDDINAGIRVRQIEREYEEMLEALSNLYRVMFMDLPPLEED